MKSREVFVLSLTLVCLLSGWALSGTPATAQPSRGSEEKVTLEVMNPRGEIPPKPLFGIQRRVPDLAGKKIGLVDNTKTGVKLFFDRLEKQLKERFPTATILRFRKTGYSDRQPALYKDVAAQCDTFVLAIGD